MKVIYEAECPYCGEELEVEKAELMPIDPAAPGDGFEPIVCPECDEDLTPSLEGDVLTLSSAEKEEDDEDDEDDEDEDFIGDDEDEDDE